LLQFLPRIGQTKISEKIGAQSVVFSKSSFNKVEHHVNSTVWRTRRWYVYTLQCWIAWTGNELRICLRSHEAVRCWLPCGLCTLPKELICFWLKVVWAGERSGWIC
jgi:hypothetical protein